MDSDKKFSSSIPANLIPSILESGKENFDQLVYRVSKSGLINADAFLNSYDERIKEKRDIKNLNLDDIGTYSTSCYLSAESLDFLLGILKRRYFEEYPSPRVIMGYTVGGLSQRTIERDPKTKGDHVDWWIYSDAIDEVVSDFQFYDEN